MVSSSYHNNKTPRLLVMPNGYRQPFPERWCQERSKDPKGATVIAARLDNGLDLTSCSFFRPSNNNGQSPVFSHRI
jgi:hypothetical protein